jgi:hypothetical protein
MKDLEFAVDDASGNERIFKSFDEAAGFAISLACSDGEEHNIDVLCWSKAAARAWGGEDAVESYREDPDASVTQRIVVRAENVGRVA